MTEISLWLSLTNPRIHNDKHLAKAVQQEINPLVLVEKPEYERECA